MAVSLVGEAQTVAAAMKCASVDFREYCAGRKEPTPEEFERLITLIIYEQGKLIARNRELTAQVRARPDKPR